MTKRNFFIRNITYGAMFLVRLSFVLAFAAVVAWLVGLSWFYNKIPKDIKGNVYQTTDAVVVLTGGSARIDSGILLLKKGLGKKLFISGVGKGVKFRDLLVNSGYTEDQISDVMNYGQDIILGRKATNTRENAEEAGEWIKKNGIKSIYLVTANYHMPRAEFEFNRKIRNTEILIYPAFPEDFKVNKWLVDLNSTLLILSEYNKFVAALLRIKVTGS